MRALIFDQEFGPLNSVLFLQLLGFIVSGMILSLPALRFRIVPKRAMHDRAHVKRYAISSHRDPVHRTPHRCADLRIGRRTSCRIRCELGINAKVTPGVWQDAVNAAG